MKLSGNKDKDMKYIASLVLLFIASIGMAQGVPNTFTAGTPALAAEVNENFTDLDTRLTTGEQVVSQLFAEIDFLYVETSSVTGVVQSLCPVDTIGISPSCVCEGDGDTSNFGVLFACAIFPEGAVGACYPDGTLFDPNLPTSPVSATAVCVSAILVDGSIASTSPIAAASSSAMHKSSAMKMTSTSEDTLQGAAVRYENQISAIRSARLLKQ